LAHQHAVRQESVLIPNRHVTDGRRQEPPGQPTAAG
jgi:hypothetical protein